MELSGLPTDVLAALMPEEEPRTAVAVIPDYSGVPELHVTVGPVTFRLLDRAGLDALSEVVAVARAAADATWRTCQVCNGSDALVTDHGTLVGHLACTYDESTVPTGAHRLALVQ